jgi:hypothetical protein
MTSPARTARRLARSVARGRAAAAALSLAGTELFAEVKDSLPSSRAGAVHTPTACIPSAPAVTAVTAG